MRREVTVTISTKNRYFTTLPHTLISIANQTLLPYEVIIFDDGDHLDLREVPLYPSIFSLFDRKGIKWKVIFGEGKGQVLNHQKSIEISETPFVWRLDDDNIAEPNVLEILYNTINRSEKVGAVGGIIPNPNSLRKCPSIASNKIEDIYLGLNVQWYNHDKLNVIPVDHLYSSFLFRKEAAEHGYCMRLSPVGHREETIFTYEMKLNGWNLLVNPRCTTWHFQEKTGGIRSSSNIDMWQHDDSIFQTYMTKWKIKPNNYKFIVLDSGLGDHYAFKSILPEIKDKFKDDIIIVFCCYPEVFENDKEIRLASIEDAIISFGNIDNYNVYRLGVDLNWSAHITDLYRKLYL